MKCPKCGLEMTKATAAEVYLCLSCGTRARLVVDEPEPHPIYIYQYPLVWWTGVSIREHPFGWGNPPWVGPLGTFTNPYGTGGGIQV